MKCLVLFCTVFFFGFVALVQYASMGIKPTGENIVYRTDRLPLPCKEVSE